MSRANCWPLAAVILFCVGLAGSACEKKGGKPVDAEQLLESRCSTCHFSTDVYAALKTPEQWKTTVERMRGINPAMISPEEGEIITAYLQEQARKIHPPRGN